MTIVLDEIDEPAMWQLIRWMAERSNDWVLIGGLMVATFDLEYGHDWRQTHDVDSLFDVRSARRGAIRQHVEQLRQIGFEFVAGREGLGHRLAREGLIIDVLSAEHFPEAPLVSLSPRFETFQTPGGSQAFAATRNGRCVLRWRSVRPATPQPAGRDLAQRQRYRRERIELRTTGT